MSTSGASVAARRGPHKGMVLSPHAPFFLKARQSDSGHGHTGCVGAASERSTAQVRAPEARPGRVRADYARHGAHTIRSRRREARSGYTRRRNDSTAKRAMPREARNRRARRAMIGPSRKTGTVRGAQRRTLIPARAEPSNSNEERKHRTKHALAPLAPNNGRDGSSDGVRQHGQCGRDHRTATALRSLWRARAHSTSVGRQSNAGRARLPRRPSP